LTKYLPFRASQYPVVIPDLRASGNNGSYRRTTRKGKGSLPKFPQIYKAFNAKVLLQSLCCDDKISLCDLLFSLRAGEAPNPNGSALFFAQPIYHSAYLLRYQVVQSADIFTQGSLLRLEIARQLGVLYAENPNVAAVIVGGSTARGHADRFSDIEVGVFWHEAPTDAERQSVVERANADLIRLYPLTQAKKSGAMISRWAAMP
jgi:hypothetical protein